MLKQPFFTLQPSTILSSRSFLFSSSSIAAATTTVAPIGNTCKDDDDDDDSIENSTIAALEELDLEELQLDLEELRRMDDDDDDEIDQPLAKKDNSSKMLHTSYSTISTAAMTDASTIATSASELSTPTTRNTHVTTSPSSPVTKKPIFVYPENLPSKNKTTKSIQPPSPPRILATHCPKVVPSSPRLKSKKKSKLTLTPKLQEASSTAAAATTTLTPKVIVRADVPKTSSSSPSTSSSSSSSSRNCACSSCKRKDEQLRKQAKEMEHMKDVIQKLLVMISKNNNSTTTSASTTTTTTATEVEVAYTDTQDKEDQQQHPLSKKTPSLKDSSSDDGDLLDEEKVAGMEPECIPSPKMKLYERLRKKTSACAPEDTTTPQDEEKVRHVRMCIEGQWGYYSGMAWKPDTTLKGCVVRFDNGDLYVGSIYNHSYCGLGKYYPKRTRTNSGQPINIERPLTTETTNTKEVEANPTNKKILQEDDSKNIIRVEDYY